MTEDDWDFQHDINVKSAFFLARAAGNRLGGLPFTVVIDRQGRAAHVALGVLDEKSLAPLLERLL